MSELLQTDAPHELWHEGINQTSDAIIIDPATKKILLIERSDGGGWALPGGFVDPSDPTGRHTAIREAREEASIELQDDDVPLIFQGIVDDPRNGDDRWIETQAYLFRAPSTEIITAGDDAVQASWHAIDALPKLYASHSAIVERALDHLSAQTLIDTFSNSTEATSVLKGHMEYQKSIAKRGDKTVFCKHHDAMKFADPERADRSLIYLQKEAATMAHLRTKRFDAVPEQSLLHGNTLLMNALPPEEGWHWKADSSTLHQYVKDSLDAFHELEARQIPSDRFDIEPSYQSFSVEGWVVLDDKQLAILTTRFDQFFPRLRPHSRQTAIELMQDLPQLRKLARQPHTPDEFVFCHHDARQSNLAWHPDHGVKLVDWSWAGFGAPGSDATSFLIDLNKAGFDVTDYSDEINPQHCLKLVGFWLSHTTWPIYRGDDTVRFQQFVSALSGYEILKQL